MALVKVKPTSPGRRGLVKVVNASLYKGRPIDALTESKKRGSGRNNNGHITMRHQGGGHKQQYRIVDFRRIKDGIPAKVERLEYDPNRSANLALLLYTDGERRYIVAPRGVEAGAQLMSGADAPIKPGNCLPLRNIPVGTTIHCVEMLPGKGAQIATVNGVAIHTAQVLVQRPPSWTYYRSCVWFLQEMLIFAIGARVFWKKPEDETRLVVTIEATKVHAV
jgi:large subunit ribosomal protein L2